jgi:hypothetical protein
MTAPHARSTVFYLAEWRSPGDFASPTTHSSTKIFNGDAFPQNMHYPIEKYLLGLIGMTQEYIGLIVQEMRMHAKC